MDADDPLPTADARMAACLELHALALWMDIERVTRERGGGLDEEILDEVNRQRLAASPMPPSLRDRWRAGR